MASHNLANDMEYLKLKVAALSEHTGLPEDEPDDDQDVEESKDLIAIEHDIDMEDIEEVAS
jgi:hypothetical protein